MLLLGVTLLVFALTAALAPLARHACRDLVKLPASSRVTVLAGSAAVWLAILVGATWVAALAGYVWIPCAIAASSFIGMLVLAVFTTSAKEEQERIKTALATLGVSGPFHEQSLSVRLQAWTLTLQHNGLLARAVRVAWPVLLAALAVMWIFFEGVDW
jgi:hypothetical protein